MINILRSRIDVDLHPVHFPREPVIIPAIIIRHRFSHIATYFSCFIQSKGKRMSTFNTAVPDELAIGIKRNTGAFAKTSAVISELHTYLVSTGWKLFV